MTSTLRAMQIADAAAFLLVGLAALFDWARGNERRRGYLAIALGCIGLAALASPVQSLIGQSQLVTSAAVVLFMASAAGMVLYRNSIVRLPIWGMALAAFGIVGATALTLLSGLPGPAASLAMRILPQQAAGDVLVAVWCLAILEPTYRLLRTSADLPRVQRARMRSLALGFVGLAVVLLLAVVVAERVSDTRVSIALEALALVCVPIFYLGFAPPRLVRRIWRQAEQEELSRATRDLLLFSTDRATLAGRGLHWGLRLVGGAGGLIADWDGELLATQGLGDAEARSLLEHPQLDGDTHLVRIGGRRTAIVHRLPVQAGSGTLLVVSGALSPVFGADEVDWLGGYAAGLAIALDRVRVAELSARTQAELRRARDLAESASRAKSEFLSRMSHELRTPLTAMIGFAELLLLDDLGEQQIHHVQTILRAGEHLLALINEILDIARIEEGRLSLSPEPLVLSRAVADVLDLIRPLAKGREVEVRVGALDESLMVSADHQRLMQVLINLVTNAVKYNRRGGWVEIDAAAAERTVRVLVRDSGPGLRKEELERLFSPFERLSAAGSEVDGTGLGLALSKSLMEAMNGRIGVTSEVGRGSDFWIELPVATIDPELLADLAEDGTGETGPGDGTGLVLYVEDTLSNIELVQGILGRRPELRLITATQGDSALALARQDRPDLILLDVHIPGMDGLELLRSLATGPATSTIPVVVLSADATLRQVNRFLAAGAREYLTKPIRAEVLLHALDQHLQRRPVASTREG